MAEAYTLITGSSSGFGRTIAQRLAPVRNLMLAGRSTDKLESVRKTCERPDRHRLWPADLSRMGGISGGLASLLTTERIVVDHFIHSAGLLQIQYARALEMGMVRELFNVNVFSAMEIIRSLVQPGVNHGALKSITFLASISSRMGAGGYSAYGASKAAVTSMSLSLAVELAPAVRVNSVLPGFVRTEMTTEYFKDPNFVASAMAVHPLGLGRPEDVADAVEFLSSDRARWITGQELVVDGGRMVFAPLRPGKSNEADAKGAPGGV